MGKKKVFLLALGLLFFLALFRIGLNQTGGLILKRVFEKGTQCAVSLSKPRIGFFPLRASVSQVLILCAGEGANEGFAARRISVELGFKELLKKKILLRRLELVGTRASSKGPDTGFLRTLQFIFKKKPKSLERPWHSFLSQGWSVWVPVIDITTDRGETPTLTFGSPQAGVSVNEIRFYTRDPIDDPATPLHIFASGRDLSLYAPDAPVRNLGDIEGKVLIGSGMVMFTDISVQEFSQPVDRRSKISASGILTTKSLEVFSLSYQARLYDDVLRALVDPHGLRLDALSAELQLRGKLSGPLFAPETEGELDLKIAEMQPLPIRANCLPRVVSARYAASPNRFSLEQLKLDDLLDEAAFVVLPRDDHPFLFEAKTAVRKSSEFALRCLSDEGRMVLHDSKGAINLSGSLHPLRLEGELTSQSFDQAQASKGQLVVKLNHADTVTSVSVTDLIGDRKGNSESEAPFKAVLSYSGATNDLFLSELSVQQYPASRIFARVSPFLPEETNQIIAASIDENSSLSAHGTVQMNLESKVPQGSGEFQAERFFIFGQAVSNLRLPFVLQAGQVSIRQASLESTAGVLDLNFELTAADELRGVLRGAGVKLSALPWLQTTFPALVLEADLEATLSGSLQEPLLESTNLVRTTSTSGQRLEDSIVNVKVADHVMAAEVGLFGSVGKLLFSYPFGAKQEGVRAKGQFQEFPLEPFFREGLTPGKSHFTGSFQYDAGKSGLLTGIGQASITHLAIDPELAPFSITRPLRVSLKDGRLTFDQVSANIGEQELTLEGFVDQTLGWSGKLRGNWLLGLYLTLFEGVENISGNLSIDLSVSGDVFHPKLVGPIQLRNGFVSLPLGDTVLGAENIEADAQFTGDTLEVPSIRAQVGEGVISGKGSVTEITSATERTARFSFDLKEVQLEPLNDLYLRLGGDLSVFQKGADAAQLVGRLVLEEGLYFANIDFGAIIQALTRTLLGRQKAIAPRGESTVPGGETKENVVLSLEVVAENGLIIDSNVVQAELEGNLLVEGSSSQPILTGSIGVVDGSFTLNSNTFEILTGRANFIPQKKISDPSLVLVGETTVRTPSGEEHLVQINIGGRLSNPRVKFSSDGGLSEREIVSRLGVGTGSGRFEIIGGAPPEASFRELISPSSDLTLKQRLAGLTGFQDVRIETGVSTSSGEFVPKVFASRPLSPLLDFRIESELSGDRGSAFTLNRLLGPTTNLFAGWRTTPVTDSARDSSGSFSVGFQYKETFPGFVWSSDEVQSLRRESPQESNTSSEAVPITESGQ